MKRSFYQMLDVTHDADQASIENAYALAVTRLGAKNLRGSNEAATDLNLVREGYLILTDPAKRAKYDAQLTASESGVNLMFFPEDSASRRKLGLETVIFAVLASVLGGVVYHQLSSKMNDVRIEHAQAVTRQKEEQAIVKTIDATQPGRAVASAESKDQKR